MPEFKFVYGNYFPFVSRNFEKIMENTNSPYFIIFIFFSNNQINIQ